MTIQEALKMKTKGKKLNSRSTGMCKQGKNTLLFWLLLNPDTNNDDKIQLLKAILSAQDWYLEEET